MSWQYGLQSDPLPGSFGGYIKVRLPESLPTLSALYGIFVSVSTPSAFYQTFLGYRTDGGWHVSAGSTNPALPCDLHCPPYSENGVQYVPQAGATFELGVKLDDEATAYFIDGGYREIFRLPETGLQQGPVGCVLESYDYDSSDLQKMPPFEILSCAKSDKPGWSSGWPHAYVYGPTSGTPYGVNIVTVSPQHLFIGYKVGSQAQQLW